MTKARNIADLGSNDVIETTATGVDVTGTVTADGLVVENNTTDVKGLIKNTLTGGSRTATLDIVPQNDGAYGLSIQTSGGSGTGVFKFNNKNTMKFDLNNDVHFYEDTGTTAKFVWDSSAERLELGTSSGYTPVSTLAINETINTPAIEIIPTADNNNANTASIRLWGTTFGTTNRHSEIRNVTDGSTANNELAFDTNGTERMRIDSAGNVGIGTASPSNNIEAHDTVDSSLALTTEASAMRFVAYSGANYIQSGTSLAGNSAPLIFTGTNGVNERARIDSSGNLLVGKTSANNTVVGIEAKSNGNLSAVADGITPALFRRKTSDGDIVEFAKDGSTVGSIASDSGNILQVNSGGNDKGVFLARNGVNVVGFAPNEANVFRPATVDSCDLGKSDRRFKDLYLSGAAYLQNSTGGSGGLRLKNPSNNTNAKIATFTGWNNTETGNISTYVNVTSYNTSSDYRLKEDIVELPTATDDVMSLKPCNFAWKGTESRMNGFIAHELAEIVPEAVTGEKDAMRTEEYEVTPAVLDDNGNVVTEAVIGTREVPEYQSIDQSKLVPLLTKALQEAITKIEQLKTRIETLENN